MDELAGMIGARPSVWRTLFTDPKLALMLLFAPLRTASSRAVSLTDIGTPPHVCVSTAAPSQVFPAQYRLRGPGAWAGARGAILFLWTRRLVATRSRVTAMDNSKPRRWRLVVALLLLLLWVWRRRRRH